MSRPLPRGWIYASATLTRTGAQRGATTFMWRRELTSNSSIELVWDGTAGIEPSASAQATLHFPIGPRYNGHRRLELRRARPDGSAGEIVYSSRFEPMPWRVHAKWSDVLAAARDGAFFGVAADRRGGIHAQTRVEGDVVAEPSRAAAMIQADMIAMIADHERLCRLDWDGEGRVILT